MTVTVAVGFQERPWAAPREGPWTSDYRVINHPSFTDAMSSISSLIFAYAGTPAFFNIAAEMREPRDYTKALIVCQTLLTAIYITVGTVVYYFCGSYVSSPALGSAGPLLKRVCYGLALPGLLVAVTLMLHVCMHPLPGFFEQCVWVELTRSITSSLRASLSLSGSSEGRNISQQTPLPIGSAGLAVLSGPRS